MFGREKDPEVKWRMWKGFQVQQLMMQTQQRALSLPLPPAASSEKAAVHGAALFAGSFGHPDLCRRPCILFMKNICRRGSTCGFCHLPHETRLPSFNLQQRHFLQKLSDFNFLQ
ncbi:unnamed protein product, partial [Durusdinium trenchii]